MKPPKGKKTGAQQKDFDRPANEFANKERPPKRGTPCEKGKVRTPGRDVACRIKKLQKTLFEKRGEKGLLR